MKGRAKAGVGAGSCLIMLVYKLNHGERLNRTLIFIVAVGVG